MKKIYTSLVLLLLVVGATFYVQPFKIFAITGEAKFLLSGAKHKYTQSFDLVESKNCTSAVCQCSLFVHGFADDYYTWGSFALSPELKSYQQNYYFVQLPYFSIKDHSKYKGSDFSVQNMAKLMVKEILPLCESWTLVGNSFGGWISAHMAYQSPEKVKALMLVDSAGLDLDYSNVIEIYKDPTTEDIKTLADQASAKDRMVPQFIREAYVKKWNSLPLIEILKAQNKEGFLDDELASLNIPVQVMWGSEDKFLPISGQALFVKQISKAEGYTIKNCGHLPQKECPDEFVAGYKQLLKRIESVE